MVTKEVWVNPDGKVERSFVLLDILHRSEDARTVRVDTDTQAIHPITCAGWARKEGGGHPRSSKDFLAVSSGTFPPAPALHMPRCI